MSSRYGSKKPKLVCYKKCTWTCKVYTAYKLALHLSEGKEIRRQIFYTRDPEDMKGKDS